MGYITEIRMGVKNKKRVNIFIDGAFSFSVYSDTADSYDLKVGDFIEDGVAEDVLREDTDKYAYLTALGYLSRKLLSEKALRAKLQNQEIPEQSINKAIEELKDSRYIDDDRYANALAEELMKKYGKYAVIQKMIQRGVPAKLAKQVVNNSDQDESVLNDWIEKLDARYDDEDPYKKKAKMIRFLTGKGFSYDEVNRAMKDKNL